MICGICSDQLDQYWPLLSRILEPVITGKHSSGLYTMSWVYACVKSQKCQLWVVTHGGAIVVVVTTINNYPAKRVLEVLFVAGNAGDNFDEMLSEGWETLKAFANDKGCKEIMGMGRKGWIKAIKDDINTFTGWRYLCH